MSTTQTFTKSFLEKLSPPVKRTRAYYKDANSGILRLSVTRQGTKSFFVQKKVNGKSVRVTLGKYPGLSIFNARKKASEVNSQLSMGVNPIEEKKGQVKHNVTLKQAFNEYLKAKELSSNTQSNYQTIMIKYLEDWLDSPLRDITREKVLKRFKKLSVESLTSANKTMRVLRAIFNYSMGLYEDSNGESVIQMNPVDKITQLKLWNKETRKQGYIKPEELNNWTKGVLTLYQYNIPQNEAIADYLIVSLLTGLRRNEVLRLRTEDIDHENELFTVQKTKNGTPHVLPLMGLVKRILAKRVGLSMNGYLFESRVTGSHICDFRQQVRQVREESSIYFTPHDLRRTFATYAQSCDIPELLIKRLLNHKERANVTLGYIVENKESLIKPLKAINSYIMEHLDQDTTDLLISASTRAISSEAVNPK